MPFFDDPRHEEFAKALADGATVSSAATIAGIELVACDKPVGDYVYLLVDPRNNHVFYVGKGRGRRHGVHWMAMLRGHIHNVPKHERLAAIYAQGLRVRELCVADSLSEDQAYELEQAIIRTIGFASLSNILPGVRTLRLQAAYKARNLLHRVVPFEDWVSRRVRSASEIKLYWMVLAGLEAQCGSAKIAI